MTTLFELAPTEQAELQQHETVIERGLATFVDVGTALLAIRDKRLYRRDYGTFEEYCRERWGMARNYANKIVAAAEVVKNLGTIVPISPTNEAQTRPLTKLEPSAQAEAWQRAVETAPNGKVTAAHVERTIEEMTAPPLTESEVLAMARLIRQERSERTREERIERINDIALGNQELGTVQRCYPVLYADPPWRYEHSKTVSREIENHYPTMSLEEICRLPVADVATPDSIIYLWTTSPKLEESLTVLKAWDYTYRTCLVWVKDKIGMGYYARQRHELLLIGKRGNFPVPEVENRFDSVIEAPRTEHSAKPEMVYTMIERMYPEFPKLELFARTKRAGWDSWGNQA